MREQPVSYTENDSVRLNDEGARAENLYANGRSPEDVSDNFVVGLFGEHAFASRFGLVDRWWTSVSQMYVAGKHDDGGYDFVASLNGVQIKIDVKCHPVGSDWMLAGSVKRKPRAHVYVCTLLDSVNKCVWFAGWCLASTLIACPSGIADNKLGCRIDNLFPIDSLFAKLSNVTVR